MHAACVLLIVHAVTLNTSAAPNASPANVSTPSSAPAAADAPASTIDPVQVGLALTAGGAALAAGGAALFTLAEAFNKPDQAGQPRNELLVQAGGLATTGIVAGGVATMLAGGITLLNSAISAPEKQVPAQ